MTATSAAVLNTPAEPATPPMMLATSSCTVPRSSPREVRASVAARRFAWASLLSQVPVSGLKPVSRRPSGSVSSFFSTTSRRWPVTSSTRYAATIRPTLE